MIPTMDITQKHHYIPCFILRSFTETFSDKNDKKDEKDKKETRVIYISHVENDPYFVIEKRPTHKNRGRTNILIKTYSLSEGLFSLRTIGQTYVVPNLYKDSASDDCIDLMHVEKELAKLENSVSGVVRDIHEGTEHLTLTRSKLKEFKKFFAVLSYRSERRKVQFEKERLDHDTRHSTEGYLEADGSSSIHDDWFQNLKWFVNADTEKILKEVVACGTFDGIANADKELLNYCKNTDFFSYIHSYVCIWEAEEGSEFILTDGCFANFKDCFPGTSFQFVYVISPKYSVVLSNQRFLKDPKRKVGVATSRLEKYHSSPDIHYTNQDSNGHNIKSDKDEFIFNKIKVSRKDVWLVNCITLSEEHSYLSYKSDVSIYKSLAYFNKVEDVKFANKYDHSDLRRLRMHLFDELNRTHPIE